MTCLVTLESNFNVEVFSGLFSASPLFINKYLDIYKMPGIVPGGRDTMVNKTYTAFGIRELVGETENERSN